MRKVYFKLRTGAIGLESYFIKVFLFYVPYLRENGVEPVAIITVKPSNQTLWRLIKRKFGELKIEYREIFSNRFFSIYYNRIKERRMLKINPFNMCLDRHVGNSKRYLDYIIHEHYEYAEATGNFFDFDAINSPDILHNFSEEENKLAAKELQKMLVKGNFVCIHARDSTFYPNIICYDANRNTPFENFLLACNNLNEAGVYTLRMGSKQVKVHKEIFNQNIIDYSGKFRTDFMDIWLIANCKFFLGNNSGLFYVSYLFCKPCAIVNYPCFLESVPFGVNDIYTPQRLWDKSRKRFLTFKEIAEYDIGLDCWNKVRFDKEGFECINSTPEEILGTAKEMNDVLDGKYQYTEEDNYLQQKFKSVFKVYHAPYHTPARVGREFLKQNKELFL